MLTSAPREGSAGYQFTDSQLFRYEAGGIAFHSGAAVIPVRPVNGTQCPTSILDTMYHLPLHIVDLGHHLTLPDIQENVVISSEVVFAPTEVIEIENTLNGTIIPQDDILAIATFARANNIKMHLDGARIWHVAAETGMSLKELCEPFDSVSLCFSKGLGELYPIFIPHFLLLLSLTSIYSDRCAGWFMPRRQQGVYREGPMVPQVIRRGYAPDRYTRWRSGIRCDTQLPASSEGARAHQEARERARGGRMCHTESRRDVDGQYISPSVPSI